MTPNLLKLADDLELDRGAYELRRDGKALRLSRIPMELLLMLVERRGDLVTREEIVARLWGKDVFLDTDNSINAAIRKLRQVLDDDPEQPRFIHHRYGQGIPFCRAGQRSQTPRRQNLAAHAGVAPQQSSRIAHRLCGPRKRSRGRERASAAAGSAAS